MQCLAFQTLHSAKASKVELPSKENLAQQTACYQHGTNTQAAVAGAKLLTTEGMNVATARQGG
jgi:hypothetical protein